MEGLSTLVNLRVLDVSSNKLTSVNDIQNLTQYVQSSLLRIMLSLIRFISLLDSRHAYRLEDLWLNDNQIESLKGVAEAVISSREKLTTIYLENNPCVRYSLTWRTNIFRTLTTCMLSYSLLDNVVDGSLNRDVSVLLFVQFYWWSQLNRKALDDDLSFSQRYILSHRSTPSF